VTKHSTDGHLTFYAFDDGTRITQMNQKLRQRQTESILGIEIRAMAAITHVHTENFADSGRDIRATVRM
jgi:hypothetical protein